MLLAGITFSKFGQTSFIIFEKEGMIVQLIKINIDLRDLMKQLFIDENQRKNISGNRGGP